MLKRSIILLAIVGLLGSAPVHAIQTQLVGDYVITQWQVVDGLPQSSVTSIIRTPDGYLWLTTFNGLVRFDGLRFVVFDPANSPGLPSGRIIRSYMDRAGGLWLTTESKALVRLWQGRFTTCGANVGVPSGAAERIGEDPSGGLWLTDSKEALYQWRDNRFVQVAGPGGFGPGQISKLVDDGDGNFWFKQGNGAARWVNGKFIALPGEDGQQPAVVNHLTPLGGGGMWVMSPDALRRYRAGRWTGEKWAHPAFKTSFYGSFTDRFGHLWIGTFGDGVYRFAPESGWTHFTTGSGLENKAVRSVYADAEGSVWVGTDGGGLHRFRRRAFRSVGVEHGMPENLIRSVTQDATGRVWVSVKDEPLGSLEEERGIWTYRSKSWPNAAIWYSVLADRTGGLWLGAYLEGLYHSLEGALTRFPDAAGHPIGTVRALFEDRRGGIWLAGDQGVSRFQGKDVKHYGSAEGLSSLQVRGFAEDSLGRLYIATEAGLNRLSDGRITVFDRAQGLLDNDVTAVCVDGADTVWLATERSGLHRFKADRFTAYGAGQGVSNPGITGLITDDEGRLWVAGKRGILRLKLAELEAVAAGKPSPVACVHYDRLDGLATPQCSDNFQPSIWKAKDGQIWFATAKGVAVVNPKQLVDNPWPPPVLIEEVRVDGQTIWSGMTAPSADPILALNTALPSQTAAMKSSILSLQPRSERIEFQFTALSFASPENVRFRFRLDGFDSGWIHEATARLATYTRLAPGRYRFQVQACNNDGIWNESGAALALVVLPPWWQTWWFQILAFLGISGVVFGFYEWRILQLQRRRDAQHEFSRRLIASQEGERKRIASELHDSLGQHLLVIKNLAALAVRSKPDDPSKAEKLEAISSLASQAVGEVRHIAAALRPFELDRLGLTKALTWLIKPAGESSNILFTVEIDELDGILPPEFEINLYRVVQESLSNILKHSQATTALVQIKREPNRLRMTIRDNGRGFMPMAAGTSTARGMGLTDIAERIRIMGGQLTIAAVPSAGTRLHILIPLVDLTKNAQAQRGQGSGVRDQGSGT